MNKELNNIFKILFLASFVFLIFTPKLVNAKETKLTNCNIVYLQANTSGSLTCSSRGQVESYYLNCTNDSSQQLTLNEVCCCTQNITYSCNWAPIKKSGTATNENIAPECAKNEKVGSDCDPNTKPEAKMVAGTLTQPLCCCPSSGGGADANYRADIILPQLSIAIDTVKLSQEVYCTGEDNSGDCYYPWIAEYINGIYKYGFGVAGILAAIMLMAGGIIWLISAGDASKITQAKNLITGSIVGLIILSTSYIILTMINPDLVSLKALKIGEIERIVVEGDSSEPMNVSSNEIANILGIKCGQDSVAQIVNKSKGKITYSNEKRGQSAGNGLVYLDCSSFTSFVQECAGLPSGGTYTGTIFKDSIIFNDPDTSNLKPGDLIGWGPQHSGDKEGHVLIYLGNKLFGDVHGGDSGREPGNAVGLYSLASIKESAARHNVDNLYIKK